MPLYRHADRMLLLIHIPKTGGSTVEEVLHRRGAQQALKSRPRKEFSVVTPQHMHWDLLLTWVPPGFYNQSVSIVRNPYARLASEYRWRSDLHKANLNKARASADQPVDAEAPPAEMLDFDTWLQHQFKAYPKRPMILDNHIRPQVEFVGPDTQIFRLEDGLDAAINHCLTQLNMPLRNLKVHQARKSASQPIPTTAARMAQVAEFYKADFEAFGYPVDEIPADLFTL